MIGSILVIMINKKRKNKLFSLSKVNTIILKKKKKVLPRLRKMLSLKLLKYIFVNIFYFII